MELARRLKTDHDGASLRVIEYTVAAAIEAAYMGVADGAQAQMAVSTVKDLREHEEVLLCSCRGPFKFNLDLFVTPVRGVKIEGELRNYHLRRNQKNGARNHAATCIFYRDHAERSSKEESGTAAFRTTRALDLQAYLDSPQTGNLVGECESQPRGTDRWGSRPSDTSARRTLSALMNAVWTDAGLQRFVSPQHEDPADKRQVSRSKLSEALKRVIDREQAGLTLEGISLVDPERLDRLQQRAYSKAFYAWKKPGLPIGFVFAIVTHIRRDPKGRKTFVTNEELLPGQAPQQEVELPFWVTVAADIEDPEAGPFMLALRYVVNAAGEFECVEAFARQIFSRVQWMLIDSHLERLTARDVHMLLAEAWRRHRLPVAAERTVLFRSVGGQRISADFLLELRDKPRAPWRAFLETNGNAGARYWKGKRPQHATMRTYGRLLLDNRAIAGRGRATARLRKKFNAWIDFVLAAQATFAAQQRATGIAIAETAAVCR